MSKKKAIDHDIIKYDDTIKDESGLKPIDFRFLANASQYSPLDPFVLGWLSQEHKNNIVLKELYIILNNWKINSPSKVEILHDLEYSFYFAYACERYYYDPILKPKVSKEYDKLNKMLLNAKSLEESLIIVQKAEKDGVKFSQPYVNLLSLAIFLKDMEKKGQLELALEELYLVNTFNKSYVNMMTARKEKELENLKTNDFILKTEKKIGSFIEYLDQVEDYWHPLQKGKNDGRVSKNEAIANVFNQHIKDADFKKLIKEQLKIDISYEEGILKAFKLFRRMFNRYTNYYYKIETKTKNGHEKNKRVLTAETKEKIGKAIRQRNVLKKKQKRRRRFHPVTVKNGQIELSSRKRSSSSSHS